MDEPDDLEADLIRFLAREGDAASAHDAVEALQERHPGLTTHRVREATADSHRMGFEDLAEGIRIFLEEDRGESMAPAAAVQPTPSVFPPTHLR